MPINLQPFRSENPIGSFVFISRPLYKCIMRIKCVFANRLLKRVRDFAEVKYDGMITYEVAAFALDLLEVDKMGLDMNDRTILMAIIERFGGGPVGLDNLAAAIGEDAGTIEDVYEPYLVQNDFIIRTPKGRVVTDFTYQHFGISR